MWVGVGSVFFLFRDGCRFLSKGRELGVAGEVVMSFAPNSPNLNVFLVCLFIISRVVYPAAVLSPPLFPLASLYSLF